MEKRFALFLVLSALVLLTHLMVQSRFRPPRAKPPGAAEVARDTAAQPAAQQPAAQPAEAAGPAAAPQPPPQAGPAETPATTTPGAEGPAPESPALETPPGPAPRVVAQQRLTLGSMSPDSPFRLLVTLNNRGAAVERIELVERGESGHFRYQDLEDKHGYVGHLAPDDAPERGGCVVNVVGPGTPAALAEARTPGTKPGLQVGDVVTSFQGQPVRDREDFEFRLSDTRPGETVELVVQRRSDGASRALTFAAQLTSHPLSIIRPEMNPELQALDPFSFLLSLETVGTKTPDRDSVEIPQLPSLREGPWEVRPLPDSEGSPAVEFRWRLEDAQLRKIGACGPLEIVKRYRLARVLSEPAGVAPGPAYHVVLDLEFHNLGSENLPVAYRLDGPTGLPLEGWWYSTKIHPRWFASAGARDVVWNSPSGGFGLIGTSEIYNEARRSQEKKLIPGIPLFVGDPRPKSLDYLGVDTQYFAVAIRPEEFQPGVPPVFRQAAAMPAGELAEKNKAKIRTADVTFRLASEPQTIVPGKPWRQSFTVFAGPKLPALLNEYHLGNCIQYGWFPMIAQPLSWILHVFASLPLVNYGVAIILLTALVRGSMVPVSRKAARNAQVMQELAPEMKKISEKYKNDMEKLRKAQSELFAKHNCQPLGGCLLMFLQLPIFIGLYRCLSVDVALRQASLIPGVSWCSNLAGPDMLWYWKPYLFAALADETGWLGPYFNVFPIVTIILFLVQQKMFTPPATDEQTRMQQQMMQWMMVFMGVMFFKVPSGLCVYFIASSLWGIAERKLLPPVGKPTPNARPPRPWLAKVRSGWERLGDLADNRSQSQRRDR